MSETDTDTKILLSESEATPCDMPSAHCRKRCAQICLEYGNCIAVIIIGAILLTIIIAVIVALPYGDNRYLQRRTECWQIYNEYVYHVTPDDAAITNAIIQNVTSNCQFSHSMLYSNMSNPRFVDVGTYVLLNNIHAKAGQNLRALAKNGVYGNALHVNDLVFQVALMSGDFDIVGLQYNGDTPEAWQDFLTNFNLTQYANQQYKWQILNAVMSGNVTYIQWCLQQGAPLDFDWNIAFKLAIATRNWNVTYTLWQKPLVPDFTASIYYYYTQGFDAMVRLLYQIYLGQKN